MLDLLQSPEFWQGVPAGLIVGAILGATFAAAMAERTIDDLRAQLATLRDQRMATRDSYGPAANDDTAPRTARSQMRGGPR